MQRYNRSHVASTVQDDGTGLERWVFTPVPGGYTITAAGGRTGCSQLLGSSSCDVTDAVSMYAQVGHRLVDKVRHIKVDSGVAAAA